MPFKQFLIDIVQVLDDAPETVATFAAFGQIGLPPTYGLKRLERLVIHQRWRTDVTVTANPAHSAFQTLWFLACLWFRDSVSPLLQICLCLFCTMHEEVLTPTPQLLCLSSTLSHPQRRLPRPNDEYNFTLIVPSGFVFKPGKYPVFRIPPFPPFFHPDTWILGFLLTALWGSTLPLGKMGKMGPARVPFFTHLPPISTPFSSIFLSCWNSFIHFP